MRLLFLLSVLSLSILGCTSTTVITPHSPRGNFDQVNADAKHYTAHVLTSNNVLQEGHSVRISPDSVKWKLIEPLEMQSLRASGINFFPEYGRALPVSRVREIRIHNTDRGLRDGLLIGLLAACTAGIVVQVAQLHYLPVGSGSYSVWTAQLLLEVSAGVVTGGIIGSTVGSTSVIRFEDNAEILPSRN